MDNNTIKKVWGVRQRLICNDQTEVDLLTLDKNTACSIHNHDYKINRFVLLEGKVSIKSDLGTYDLVVGQPFDVEPPLYHQFIVHEDSKMVELAYAKEGKIDADDINRVKQGGRFIKKIDSDEYNFFTLEELKLDEWKDYD